MKRAIIGALALIAVVSAGVLFLFLRGRTATAEEWASKLPRQSRTMAEVRGLVNNMIEYRRETVPSFVPASGLDNQLCAAAVINAVNFLLGENRLKMSTAWEFSHVNADAVRLIYDRHADFAVKDGRIIEQQDRRVWLSKILSLTGLPGSMTSDRLYIIGYHYRETVSDPKILEAKADMNSHLMLILGRRGGKWWGYHFLHDPKQEQEDPARIDDLGDEMPKEFDLMYIWEVKQTEMTLEERPLVLVQTSLPYHQIHPFLKGAGNGATGYIVDTVVTQLIGVGQQFPRVVDISAPVAELIPPERGGRWQGEILGFYHGVAIRHHAGVNTRGRYGLEFQCVEFVNRYYAFRFHHRNMEKTGHADSYFYETETKGLIPYPNGSPEPPHEDDILVFDDDGPGSHPGHVGIIYHVDETRVCLVQQNMDRWFACLPLSRDARGWRVGAISERLPCVGWARKGGGQ